MASAGKVWFITGASRGFGRVWAQAALERGDRVAVTARDTSRLEDLVAAYGEAVLALPLDVTDRAAAGAAVRQAAERFGRLDVVVNNAGYGQFGAIEEASEQEFRAQFASPNEKIVLFVGRGVREKGCQVLVDAMPRVRARYNDAKLVVAGGGYRQHLIDQAKSLGIGPYSYFTGFIPDQTLLRLYKVADVACFPSLYEPFGIVALEGMAAHTPVVVSNAGGLPEVVEHDVTGTVTFANSPDSLAWGISRVLHNPDFARAMADRAYERIETVFNWSRIADQTTGVYARVWGEYVLSGW